MKVKTLIYVILLLFIATYLCEANNLDLNFQRTDESKSLYCKYQKEGYIKNYGIKLNALYNNTTNISEKGEVDIEGTKEVKENLDIQVGYNYFKQDFVRNRMRVNARLLGMVNPDITVRQGFVISGIRHAENKILCLTGIGSQLSLAGQRIRLSYDIMTDFDKTNDKYVKLEITRQMSSMLALGYSVDKRWEETERIIEKLFIQVRW